MTTPFLFVPTFSWPAAPGGLLYTYSAGGTSAKTTYSDAAASVPNANPVVLDSNGSATVRLGTGSYHLVLKDSTGQTTLWDQDNYSPIDATSVGLAIWGQTTAEVNASVTPTNYAYAPGDVRRYGAIGDGSTDDSTAFANAALVCGTHPMLIPYTSSGYKIVTPFVLPTNATVIGLGKPKLFATVNGKHICSCVSGTEITISGIQFVGTSASTVPLTSFGGFVAANTGLVTLANCTDIRIVDCEFSTFYNGVTMEGCARVWVQRNKVSSFQSTGVLMASTDAYEVEFNLIQNCTQVGGVVAYGVQATGNSAGGLPSSQSSISFNRINNIPSWDGIGSHEVNGLRVIGNDIRNVRTGIDIGHLTSSNVVQDLIISGNYIEATNTDTWATAAAAHAGIAIAGFDATHRVLGAAITGNTIRGFFLASGIVGTAYSSNIVIAHADDANLTGNIVTAAVANSSDAGIYVNGTCNRLTIGQNSLQGGMTRGAIRIDAVISDVASIHGVSMEQLTPANGGISITGSTISAFSVGGNPTNATPAYSDDVSGGGSTLTFIGGSVRSSFVATLNNCTTAPTGNIIYTVNDDIVTLEIPTITAGSNNTTAPTLSGIPASLIPVDTQHCIGQCQDNSSTQISQIRVDNSGGTLTLFAGTNSTFTASGNKGVINSTITYRRAT